MSAATPRTDELFDVLVIGGGNAGISAAARLIKRGITNVAVIEPQEVHTYRPLLSYVGGGQASMRSAERTQRSVTPRKCRWLRDSAVAVDAAQHTVRCASGATYRYRDLVVCAGLVPDNDALPDVDAAADSPAVASNYLDRAEKTWQLVQSMRSGQHAVFTVPRPPVSCTGTTVKPLFLAAAYWKRNQRDVSMTLVVDRAGFLGVPDLDERLGRMLTDLNVAVLQGAAVSAVDAAQRRITVTGGAPADLTYDMLHLVPPFRGPGWIAESGLTGDQAHGLVDIDPKTFRHRTHADVWAIGDGAAVDTDPSGGALRRQVAILVDNLLAARSAGEFTDYDGYTVAPIATDAHRLIAGEFDRSGAVTSSLPSFVDPLKPRRSAWAFDRFALPAMYWNLILNGRV
ncbi:NAD(P)/FAD-dependent oxidoreductase [Mycobacterium kubicae]|uniref:NAD(P)/FAD-dependent oxidoreductase n=1 Tax=Mycobacterium kubicae TaxID=120959 RepID=UPI0008006B21|nr:FAD/NAD(P)-binding oxidoreductase [Mycobacterium kubicae]OBK50438.1 pyridine nucleotide-disulfide oxidoreductase [Mycobacterium kubicae]